MKQHETAACFQQMADLLEYCGDNPFRVRAYRRAAQNLSSFTGDLEALDAEARLTEISGIGRDLAHKIHEFLATGRIAALSRLRRSVPRGVLELVKIPGVGPKTARVLCERLRITTIDQLEAAVRAHRLLGLPGFQATKEANILRGIAILRRGRERMRLGTALPLAQALLAFLAKVPGVGQTSAAGSLRRMCETIGDLDLLAASSSPRRVMAAFCSSPFVARVLARGDTKSSILTRDDLQVDLRVVPSDSFGAALQYFTGSKEHNVRLREMAVRRGLKVNEYGVFRVKGGARIAGREEADVYAALGLPWIPPELREDRGELDAARARQLPRLVEAGDIRGDFHIHSRWSDGSDRLEVMAEAGRARGYEYLAMCDHSPLLKVAHGMTAARLRSQLAVIDGLNARATRYRVLKGAEVDILPDGRLDYPDAVLQELDVVTGSVHTNFRQGRELMTRRIIRAMRHPLVTLIAHPTGRIIGRRDPYDVDLDAVLRAAADTRTALEINASPERLDLCDTAAAQARQRGVMLALSTDAHSRGELNDMAIGLGVARRAWLQPRHLLNCFTLRELLTWVAVKRRGAR